VEKEGEILTELTEFFGRDKADSMRIGKGIEECEKQNEA
jgi:hypothetical protein